ncbi:hypothetical protein ACOSQ2_029161 [Xanthoceras sorbifolium]
MRKKKRSAFVSSPYIDPTRPKKQKTRSSHPIKFEPLKPVHKEVKSEYEAFKKNRKARCYIGAPLDATPEFFKTFESATDWLDSLHIEAYLSVLRRCQLSHPTIFSQNYNLIDPTFFTTLQHIWKKLSKDKDGTIPQEAYDPLTFPWEDFYLGYVRGERPEGSRPWWEIDNVLTAVNLVERKVRIYDSLCKVTDPSFREQYVAPLAVLLPSLMYSGGYFQHRGRQVQVTPFACKILGPDTVPQQRGAGAFTLVFAEYIVAHRQKFDFNVKQIEALRKKMSIDIFANSARLEDSDEE